VIRLLSIPLSLDLGHTPHQIPDLVTVKFSNRGNAVDVLEEVF